MTTHSVVEDLDVFANCRYGFLAGSKTALVDKLLFEMAPETFRGGVVAAVAFARHRSDQAGLLHIPPVVQRTVLGEFNGSSQHLWGEELRWQQRSIEGPNELCVPRCSRLVVRRSPVVSFGSSSGKRLPVGWRARTLLWQPGVSQAVGNRGLLNAQMCFEIARESPSDRGDFPLALLPHERVFHSIAFPLK